MVKIDNTARANLRAYIGVTGSGKSESIRRQLAADAPPRLMVWAPEPEEYPGAGPVVSSMGAVSAALRKAGAGPLAIRFEPSTDVRDMVRQFDVFCSLAFHASGIFGGVSLVAEELADVTKAGWAPKGWSACVRKGRKRGMAIYGASQRPAEVDKTFLGNASVIRCGVLNTPADIKAMRQYLCVQEEELMALRPLEWIEFDRRTREHSRGVIAFGKSRAGRG